MGTLSINGTNYSNITAAWASGTGSALAIDTGNYYLSPPWGHPPRIGSEEHEIMVVGFPGVDGVWRKSMGFRGRPIYIQMATIGETKPLAWTALSDLMDHFKTFERFTITLPDGLDMEGCAQVPGAGEVFDEFAVASDEADTRVIILSSYQFRQYSYSNT